MTDHAAAHTRPLLAGAYDSDADASLDQKFARLYAESFPKVYAFIRSQVGHASTAQDLVSRIFLKAYRHRAKAPAGDAEILWIFRIAHTSLIDYWRVEGRRRSIDVPLAELGEIPDRVTDLEGRYAARERATLLLRVMADLSDGERELLALKFTAQRTNREIAEILGVSEAAISMRLLRALRRLRGRLQELGVA